MRSNGPSTPDSTATSRSRRVRRSSIAFSHRRRGLVHRNRLRYGIWPIEEEDRDLVVQNLTGIDGAMDAIARLVPIGLARDDVCDVGLTAITELDRENIAAQDNGDSMIRIAMPRCRFARLERQPSNDGRSAVMKQVLDHPQSSPSRHGWCRLSAEARRR